MTYSKLSSSREILLLLWLGFQAAVSVNALGVPRCVCVCVYTCAACDFPVLMSVTLTSHSGVC